jgi:hypothetical protein
MTQHRLVGPTVRRRLALVGVALIAAAVPGCSRSGHTASLAAPYDDDESLGEITAVWDNTGEERGFDGGARLKQPEVRFRYRLDARNRSGDKLFLRLADMQLVDRGGLTLGKHVVQIECTLNAGDTDGVLSGDVWVPKSAVDDIDGFRVTRLAIPLGAHSLQRYRDWLLQGRPNDAAQVDAEVAKHAGAPACAGAPS